jgi:hypothetical protein
MESFAANLRRWVRIASVLAVSVDELVGLADASEVRTSEEIFQERIISALHALQSDDLQRLVVMIEALASESRNVAT